MLRQRVVHEVKTQSENTLGPSPTHQIHDKDSYLLAKLPLHVKRHYTRAPHSCLQLLKPAFCLNNCSILQVDMLTVKPIFWLLQGFLMIWLCLCGIATILKYTTGDLCVWMIKFS